MLQKLKTLEHTLHANIKGQEHVVAEILPIISRGEFGLSDRLRPKGSFLFVGPTGTGKTELTKLFTEHLFGEEKLARIDMSEFSDAEALSRLLGNPNDPKGVLGHLLEKTEQSGTFLFDEIEKANRSVLDLLLQILDASRITLFDKSVVSFSNYYVVCTSNIGTARIAELPKASSSAKERIITEALEQTLKPEFLGRFSKRVVFESLSFKIQKEICQTLVEKELKRLAEVGYTNLQCDDSAINALFLGGYSEKYGARNMRDFIQNQIGNAIVEVLLANKTPSGKLTFSKEKNKIQFAEMSKHKETNKKSDNEFLEWFLALSKSRKV